MVIFDVGLGPAGDVGSLRAFLGVSNDPCRQKEPPKQALSAGVPFSQDINSTLLSTKVTFRMLKQLGCEVRLDSDVHYIEVSHTKQPVLFKMLVQLGHGPCRSQEEGTVVRVNEQRPRRTEELVAALSLPKSEAKYPKHCREDDSCLGRKMLRPADEEQLVKRLYVPRSKHVVPEKEGPKLQRTAAEQRAYLNRLLKPREADAIVDGPEVLRDFEVLSFGHQSFRSSSQLTWPKFSQPCVRPKVTGRRPKGSLGCLAKAGRLFFSEPEESIEESTVSESQDLADLPSETFLPGMPSLEAHGEDSLNPSSLKLDFGLTGLGGFASSNAAQHLYGTGDPSLDQQGRSAPAKASRSKDHRERLEELAKPRQLKTHNQAKQSAAPWRSPRSQREACVRLSQQRKPKADAMQDMDDDDSEDSDEGLVLVPSILGQLACSHHLERIDEEDSAVGMRGQPRGKWRRSHKAATPFSEVCPTNSHARRTPMKRSNETPRAGCQQKDVDAELRERAKPGLRNRVVQSKAMLDDIDALYSQLLAEPKDATVSSPGQQGPESSEPCQAMLLSQGYDHDSEAEPQGDGEDLLRMIDQLFHQMIPHEMEGNQTCASDQNGSMPCN